jgi:hypothetical protein
MGSPMSGESLLALAVCHAPHFDGLVPRPSDELARIRRVELETGDRTAAIFSQMSVSPVTAPIVVNLLNYRLKYTSPPLTGLSTNAKVTCGPSRTKFSLLCVRR